MLTKCRLHLLATITLLNLVGPPAIAADTPDTVRRIRIAATGIDRTSPDIARVGFTARGEGKSADEATAAVSASMKAVNAALDQVRDGQYTWTVSNLTMTQVRDKACDEGESYGPRPRLSTGACAIIGYVAEVHATLRLSPASKAGTAAGLITRAGGLNARVDSFELASPAAARRRAMASALAQAQEEAEAIAKASGVRLGTVVAINSDNDRGGNDIIVTAARVPPPPPPPPPPVEITMTPSPITTSATLNVVYSIAE
jgi:uncharacterized protein YggE